MIHINRVFTKRGDGGETDMIGRVRVSKDARRVDCYGVVDELQAVLGVVRASVATVSRADEYRQEVMSCLTSIQNTVYDAGTVLATPAAVAQKAPESPSEADIELLEQTMDRWLTTLPALTSFVLPGSGLISAYGHLARTICRRAERHIVSLRRQEPVPLIVLRYLNRLSDFLFVFSRYTAKQLGEKELLWDTPRQRTSDR